MVKLRILKKEDLDFLLTIRNDNSTRTNLENNNIFTLPECEKWFESLTSPWYIILMDEIKVGYLRTNNNEIGCDIHPNYRRKGYAKAAYKLYLKDKKYASLWVFEDNFAINLYKTLGFTPTGIMKKIRNRKYLQMEYLKLK